MRAFSRPGSLFQQLLDARAHGVGELLPDVEFTDLEEQAGKKFVVVEFWASWAVPCQRSIANLSKLAERHKDAIVAVGISDEKPEEIKAFGDMTAGTVPYHDALTRRKVVAFGAPYTNVEEGTFDDIARQLDIPMRRAYFLRYKLKQRFGATTNEHLISRAVAEGFATAEA